MCWVEVFSDSSHISKEGMRSMNADSFHRGYSYEAGPGRPVLKGSTSAEEDSSSCHTKERPLFNTIVLCSCGLDINDYESERKNPPQVKETGFESWPCVSQKCR